MVYIFGMIITLMLAYIAPRATISYGSYQKKSNAIFWIAVFSALPLILISSVRYGVGTDFFSYYNIYIDNGVTAQRLEKVFLLGIHILRKVSDNPIIFFTVTSIVIYGMYFSAIYKESCNPGFSILLFVVTMDYFRSMNAIRQYLAMAICLLAIPYIKKKKIFGSAIFIIIAFLFHKSAIIYAALFVLNYVYPAPLFVVLAIGSIFVFGNQMVHLLYVIADKYSSYGRFFLSSSVYSVSNFGVRPFLIYLSFFLLLLYVKKKVNNSENLRFLYCAVSLGLMIMAATVFMPTIIRRFTWYTDSIIMLYVPEATAAIQNKKYKWIANGMIVSLYFLIMVFSLLNGHETALPYHTFWNYQI